MGVFKKQVKPNYRLKFLNKQTEEKGEIGAAWLNEDGSIAIVLNPLVVVPQSPHLVLTLFPVDSKFRWSRRQRVIPAPEVAPVATEEAHG